MSYRLIWFHHFHKAAGSAVVEAAAANGEIFWPHQLNGNPTDEDGKQLDIHALGGAELIQFVDRCENAGVTFVATEWGLPDVKVLAADPRVCLVTCLRDPLARYVSNFYYDLHNGYTTARSLSAFKNTRKRIFTMDNYYCRILARQHSVIAEIDDAAFTQAISNLQLFHLIGFADGRLQELGKKLQWPIDIGSANVNSVKTRVMISLLLRFRWGELFARIRYPKKSAPKDFQIDFQSKNVLDYRLLELAETMSRG